MEMQILVLFGVFLITVFIGVPIGYSIALATLVVLAGFYEYSVSDDYTELC